MPTKKITVKKAEEPAKQVSPVTPPVAPLKPEKDPRKQVLLLDNQVQLEYLLSLLMREATIAGDEFVKRGDLIKAVRGSVPVDDFCNAVIMNYKVTKERLEQEQKAQEEYQKTWAEKNKQLDPKAPRVMANKPGTFKPRQQAGTKK
jgi:hypothetical protein